jgi:hypothetical protein
MSAKKEKLTLEYAARALIGAWDNGFFTEGGEPDAYIDLLREALPASGGNRCRVCGREDCPRDHGP